jgi:hypothetical protein
MNHAKTSFSTEICAGAIISVVEYLAPLRYCAHLFFTMCTCRQFTAVMYYVAVYIAELRLCGLYAVEQ